MTPPSNCPYKELTAKSCFNCSKYIPDTDECQLNHLAQRTVAGISYVTGSPTYEERLARYYADRAKLMQLSKESLVDMILKRPERYEL